jgi:hypothetical protein
MRWGKWILAYMFDCVHRHTTWPHCNRTGLDYVCCLDCGKELPYSTRRMSLVSREEQLEEQNVEVWGKGENIEAGIGFARDPLQAA